MPENGKQFTQGLYIKKPSDKAPAWLKCSIGVKVDTFISFLKENVNERGYVDIDICEAKSKRDDDGNVIEGSEQLYACVTPKRE